MCNSTTTCDTCACEWRACGPPALFYPSGGQANECICMERRENERRASVPKGLSLSLGEVEPPYHWKRDLLCDATGHNWVYTCFTDGVLNTSHVERFVSMDRQASRARRDVCLFADRQKAAGASCSARYICTAWCMFTALPDGQQGPSHSCTLV